MLEVPCQRKPNPCTLRPMSSPTRCQAVNCLCLACSKGVQHLPLPTEPCQMPCACMQVPAQMHQVLLEWEGGNRVLLVRVTDAEGVWLCQKEVHSKMGSSISRQAWHKHCQDGEHTLL